MPADFGLLYRELGNRLWKTAYEGASYGIEHDLEEWRAVERQDDKLVKLRDNPAGVSDNQFRFELGRMEQLLNQLKRIFERTKKEKG